MLPRYIVLLLLVVLPLTRVTAAWGEETSPDSTATLGPAPLITFTPAYSSSMCGNVTRLTLGNGMKNTITFLDGPSMSTCCESIAPLNTIFSP